MLTNIFFNNGNKMKTKTAKKNKVGLDEQNEWGRFRVEIEAKKGAWLDEKFPKGGTGANQFTGELMLRDTTLAKEGITKEESVQARNILHNPEEVQEVIQEIVDSGKEIVTPSLVNTRLKDIKKSWHECVPLENNLILWKCIFIERKHSNFPKITTFEKFIAGIKMSSSFPFSSFFSFFIFTSAVLTSSERVKFRFLDYQTVAVCIS